MGTDPIIPTPIWTEGTPGVLIVTTPKPISDIDSQVVSYCTFTIIDGQDGSAESLEVITGNSNILSTYQPNDYTLTLTGPASIDTFNTVVESLLYMSVTSNPTGETRNIEGICADDQGLPSESDIIEIIINPENTPPIIDLNGSNPGYSAPQITYTEDGEPIEIISLPPNTPIISDPDSDSMDNCRVKIRGATSDERLEVPSLECHVESSYDSETGVLTLQGPASIEEYEEIFRDITYVNDAQFFDPDSRNLEIVCVDEEGACSNSPLIPIRLQNVNDPPVVALDGNSATGNYHTTFTEGDEPVRLSDDLILFDVDSEELLQCTASIASAPDGVNEVLSASAPLGCNIDVEPGRNSLILQGPAGVDEFANVLSTLTYENQEQDPTPGTRKILQCTDVDGAVSETTVALVDVIPLSDAPVVDLSGTSIIGYDWIDSLNVDDEATLIAHPFATIFDLDSETLQYCEIRLPGPANPGEGFSFNSVLDEDISPEWIPGAGVLYLHGPAPTAAYDEMIRALSYVRRSNVPYDVVDISVQCVDEALHPSNVAISSLHVNHFGYCDASSTDANAGYSLDLWLHISDLHPTTTTTTTSSSSSPFSSWSSSDFNSRLRRTTTTSSSSSSEDHNKL